MDFVKPDPVFNFAAIPGTILNFFDIQHSHLALPADTLERFKGVYDSVCLVFVDAFGLCFLKHYSEDDPIAVFPDILKKSQLTKLTSQFPSTTAVHVTTINTGLPVAEAGICEWHYYESSVDKVITPLPFTDPHAKEANSLLKEGITGKEFFEEGWFFPTLKEHGVKTQIHLKNSFAASPFNKITMASAETIGFEEFDDGIRNLGDSLLNTTGNTYTYFYYDAFDAAMHVNGPFSPEGKAAAEAFFVAFNQHVLTPVKEAGKNVLFLFTADHGMAGSTPETSRYVDRDIPEILEWMRTCANGDLIRPAGSKRDLFLHLKPEFLEVAFARLQRLYSETARIYKVDDLINEGYFLRTSVSDRFRKNIGDLLIASKNGHGVYWAGDNDRYINSYRGHHGGLSRHEMETILLALGT